MVDKAPADGYAPALARDENAQARVRQLMRGFSVQS